VDPPKWIAWSDYRELPEPEMRARAAAFYAEMRRRRSIRRFADRPVPSELIEDCLRTAGTAPSGANCQPWRFVVVTDPAVKRRIRWAAEAVERQFYEKLAGREWLDALAPLGTTPQKPFLETAPYLIAVFAERQGTGPDGRPRKHYYVTESVAIAVGFLLVALHHAGLAALTYTPRPMGFLGEILDRPAHEHPMMIVVTGYPAEDATVPELARKRLEDFVTFFF
jgi:iodotyrosine deiodinase